MTRQGYHATASTERGLMVGNRTGQMVVSILHECGPTFPTCRQKNRRELECLKAKGKDIHRTHSILGNRKTLSRIPTVSYCSCLSWTWRPGGFHSFIFISFFIGPTQEWDGGRADVSQDNKPHPSTLGYISGHWPSVTS